MSEESLEKKKKIGKKGPGDNQISGIAGLFASPTPDTRRIQISLSSARRTGKDTGVGKNDRMGTFWMRTWTKFRNTQKCQIRLFCFAALRPNVIIRQRLCIGVNKSLFFTGVNVFVRRLRWLTSYNTVTGVGQNSETVRSAVLLFIYFFSANRLYSTPKFKSIVPLATFEPLVETIYLRIVVPSKRSNT